MTGVTESGSAEASYFTWVDQFDTSGLGKNVPIATGNANESLLALVDGKFVNLHVPYPMGFYPGRAHGRRQCRLEGQSLVGHLQHEGAVPHRRRQRDDEQGGQGADSTGSVSAVIGPQAIE